MEIEQIRLTQTQVLSSVGSVVCESSDDLASASIAINERVITDKVLGVRRGHHNGVGRIVKSIKKKRRPTLLTRPPLLGQSSLKLLRTSVSWLRE